MFCVVGVGVVAVVFGYLVQILLSLLSILLCLCKSSKRLKSIAKFFSCVLYFVNFRHSESYPTQCNGIYAPFWCGYFVVFRDNVPQIKQSWCVWLIGWLVRSLYFLGGKPVAKNKFYFILLIIAPFHSIHRVMAYNRNSMSEQSFCKSVFVITTQATRWQHIAYNNKSDITRYWINKMISNKLNWMIINGRRGRPMLELSSSSSTST